jgi:hypothetical protein
VGEAFEDEPRIQRAGDQQRDAGLDDETDAPLS